MKHSIMIPAYGDSTYLREAIVSVQAQSDPHWSLTVIDDGPDDPVLAAWVTTHDRRMHYERNPTRLGINANFRRCLERADGDLVTILGADDRLRPTYVEVMRATATAHPDAAWLHPSVRVIDAHGQQARPLADRLKAALAWDGPAVVGGESLAVSLLRGNWMYFPSVAFRREIVAGYSFTPGLDIVLDLDLYVRLLLDGHPAVLVSSTCFEYRRHAASLSSRQRVGPRFAEEAEYFRSIAATLDAAGWARAARAARRHLTSRLHAAVLLGGAVARRDADELAGLWRHVVTLR